VQYKKKKKNAPKTELNVLCHSTGLPSGLPVFFSVLCLLLHVIVVDKKNDLYASMNARVVPLLFILEG
jgi:hypothetical protein